MSKSDKAKDREGERKVVIFMGLWCLGFIGIPLVLAIISIYSMGKEIVSRTWTETPCVVQSMRVDVSQSDDTPFTPKAKFSYEVEGKSYSSETFQVNEVSYQSYTDAWLLTEEVRASEKSVCYVNPFDPSEAKLADESLWPMFSGMIVYGVFISIGSVVLIFMINIFSDPKPSSKVWRIGKFLSQHGVVILGSLFTLTAFVGTVFLIKMHVKTSAIKNDWKKVPCKVIYSERRVIANEDSYDDTLDIFYEYQFKGAAYRSNHYGGGNSSAGSDTKTIAKTDSGDYLCYVNPEEPWQAILAPEKRGFPMVIIALFVVVFLLFGIILLNYERKERLQNKMKAQNRKRRK